MMILFFFYLILSLSTFEDVVALFEENESKFSLRPDCYQKTCFKPLYVPMECTNHPFANETLLEAGRIGPISGYGEASILPDLLVLELRLPAI